MLTPPYWTRSLVEEALAEVVVVVVVELDLWVEVVEDVGNFEVVEVVELEVVVLEDVDLVDVVIVVVDLVVVLLEVVVLMVVVVVVDLEGVVLEVIDEVLEVVLLAESALAVACQCFVYEDDSEGPHVLTYHLMVRYTGNSNRSHRRKASYRYNK